jgi:hypothetical protein
MLSWVNELVNAKSPTKPNLVQAKICKVCGRRKVGGRREYGLNVGTYYRLTGSHKLSIILTVLVL